jgi:Cytochrome c
VKAARTSLALLALGAGALLGAACKRKSAAPTPVATVAPISAPVAAPARKFEARSRQGSALAVTRLAADSQELALVADEDERALLILDALTGKVLARTNLDSRPGQLLVLQSGLLAVTLRDKSKVVVYSLAKDTQDLELREEYNLYTESDPLALAELETKKEGNAGTSSSLYVATGHAQTLEQFDLQTQRKKVIFEIAASPRSVLALEDGTVWVSHANAGVLTQVKGTEVLPIRLDQADMFSRQGFALTSLGQDVYAPDTFVLPDDVSASMRGVASGYGGGTVCQQNGWHKGWVQDARVAKLAKDKQGKALTGDLPAKTEAEGFVAYNAKQVNPGIARFDCVQVMSTTGALRHIRSASDQPTESAPRMTVTQLGTACLLPRAAAASTETNEVYVACLGSNRVEAIDVGQDAPPQASRGFAVPKGPTALAISGTTLLVWSSFAHELSRVDISKGSKAPAASFPVARATELSKRMALGRELFHAAGDTRIAQDGRACASCHPDGMSDGIGWSTPEGRRKPMVLAGRISAGPFGWRGEHKTVREHLTKTILGNLHGTGLGTEEMESLEAYVRDLPKPAEAKDGISDEARKGKEVFARADTGCAKCHDPAANFTDSAQHDVGTGGKFRTPPLRFAAAASPYMHEGKYQSLDEFLRKTEGKMGNTGHLSQDERNALIQYVQSL